MDDVQVPVRVPPFRGQELQLELLDAGTVTLLRSYQHPNADWEPPPVEFRTNRVDPPPGHGESFAVMYTSTNIQSSAMEVRALFWDADDDRFYWDEDAASKFHVVRFSPGRPAIFIPIDGRNRAAFCLQGKLEPSYESTRWIALELYRRYGHLVHGVSYESFHRHQLGRVYAIWHSRKDDLDLSASAERPLLTEDAEFLAFLAAHPFIDLLRTGPTPNPQGNPALAAA